MLELHSSNGRMYVITFSKLHVKTFRENPSEKDANSLQRFVVNSAYVGSKGQIKSQY